MNGNERTRGSLSIYLRSTVLAVPFVRLNNANIHMVYIKVLSARLIMLIVSIF